MGPRCSLPGGESQTAVAIAQKEHLHTGPVPHWPSSTHTVSSTQSQFHTGPGYTKGRGAHKAGYTQGQLETNSCPGRKRPSPRQPKALPGHWP